MYGDILPMGQRTGFLRKYGISQVSIASMDASLEKPTGLPTKQLERVAGALVFKGSFQVRRQSQERVYSLLILSFLMCDVRFERALRILFRNVRICTKMEGC